MSLQHTVIIPAAGIGQRMGADIPKQYLLLGDRPILSHTLDCFLQDDRFERVVVAINENDTHWPQLNIQHPKLQTVTGGEQRMHSVMNALDALQDSMQKNDWVLVHDAVRPGISKDCLDRLLTTLDNHPAGGLLGVPVADTIKRVDAQQRVCATVPREQLWRAQTPQMFRYGVLCEAFALAKQDRLQVTDEASVIEYLGYRPQMVLGDPRNLKITTLEDLAIARQYLTVNAIHKQSA